MKILLVNDYSTLNGGAEYGFFVLRDRLRKCGHEAYLFSSSANINKLQHIADYKCFGTTSRFRTLLQTANLSAYLKLRQVIKRIKPDVIHVKLFLTQLSPLILPLFKNIPTICHIVWYRPICPIGTKMLPTHEICRSRPGSGCLKKGCLPVYDWCPLMFQMKLWRRWQHIFKIFVANSFATKKRLIENGIEPVAVIWNGVPARPMRAALTGPPSVVFAGRLVVEKGVDILLKAFKLILKEIPEAKLLIAGQGPEEPNLKNLIKDLHLSSSARMLGFLSQDELEIAFSKAWVQVVPSRWEEPFGFVAIEAMMRGTSLIVSSLGGLAELVTDAVHGFHVPPNDEAALAEALLKLLGNRQLAESMGNAGHVFATSKLTEDIYVDRFLKLYEKLYHGGTSY
jgi:glycosyltransferase involved in cell wall biosynthesis